MDAKKVRLILAGLLLCCLSAAAQPCGCPASPSAAEALQQSEAVFSGEVLEIVTNTVGSGVKATFRVENSWKGSTEQIITIGTDYEHANCGYPFRKGEKYLVYAIKKFTLRTDRCSRTMPLDAAAADLQSLGPGRPPAGDTGKMVSFGKLLVLLTLGGLALLGAVIFMRRRKPGPPRT